MHKSSLYLSDDLKAGLGELATRSGRTEADLIRSAVASLLSAGSPTGEGTTQSDAPLPFRSPACVGVGVGPGDPLLITELARRTLAEAGRVVTATPDERAVGRAEMVVRAAVPTARVQRVPFAFSGDDTARSDSLHAMRDAVVAGTDAGELVAVAVLGDATQWTTLPDLESSLHEVRPQLAVHLVPGIAPYQAVAAAARMPLGVAHGSLSVVHDLEHLDDALADHRTTVAVFKGSIPGEALKAAANRHDRDGIVGELADLSGNGIVPLASLPDGPVAYLATVLFPAVAGGNA